MVERTDESFRRFHSSHPATGEDCVMVLSDEDMDKIEELINERPSLKEDLEEYMGNWAQSYIKNDGKVISSSDFYKELDDVVGLVKEYSGLYTSLYLFCRAEERLRELGGSWDG